MFKSLRCLLWLHCYDDKLKGFRFRFRLWSHLKSTYGLNLDVKMIGIISLLDNFHCHFDIVKGKYLVSTIWSVRYNKVNEEWYEIFRSRWPQGARCLLLWLTISPFLWTDLVYQLFTTPVPSLKPWLFCKESWPWTKSIC